MTTSNKPAEIDALLNFLPVFEADEFEFGDWHTEEGTIPMYIFSNQASAFMRALYDNGWIISFDWGEWQNEAAKLVESPAGLESADIETVRKLLTTHVRKERFCEGHLSAMHSCGHLVAILRRLKILRNEAR